MMTDLKRAYKDTSGFFSLVSRFTSSQFSRDKIRAGAALPERTRREFSSDV